MSPQPRTVESDPRHTSKRLACVITAAVLLSLHPSEAGAGWPDRKGIGRALMSVWHRLPGTARPATLREGPRRHERRDARQGHKRRRRKAGGFAWRVGQQLRKRSLLRQIGARLSKPADRPVMLYRGFSADINTLDLNSYLDVDSPQYNSLRGTERLAQALDVLKADGEQGLHRHQWGQGRQKLQRRLSLSVSEDLAQILTREGYGRSSFEQQRPVLQILAQIEPKKMPVTHLSGDIFAEAGLLSKPKRRSVRYFMVLPTESGLKHYLIRDAKALRRAAKRWAASYQKSTSEQWSPTGSFLQREGQALVAPLLRRGVLRHAPEMDRALELNDRSITLGMDLKELRLAQDQGGSAEELAYYMGEICTTATTLRRLRRELPNGGDALKHADALLRHRVREQLARMPETLRRKVLDRTDLGAVLR